MYVLDALAAGRVSRLNQALLKVKKRMNVDPHPASISPTAKPQASPCRPPDFLAVLWDHCITPMLSSGQNREHRVVTT